MTDDRDREEFAADEPGDQDALPGFKATPPGLVPPDEGDAGEEAGHVER